MFVIFYTTDSYPGRSSFYLEFFSCYNYNVLIHMPLVKKSQTKYKILHCFQSNITCLVFGLDSLYIYTLVWTIIAILRLVLLFYSNYFQDCYNTVSFAITAFFKRQQRQLSYNKYYLEVLVVCCYLSLVNFGPRRKFFLLHSLFF